LSPLHPAYLVDAYIGNRVRMRRETLGLSIKNVAERLGLPVDEVEAIESGCRRARAVDLYGLAHLLDVKISFFFDCAIEVGAATRMASPDAVARGHMQAAQG
jgi:transcriptional regulator with XRE-family HTH domain